MVLKGHSLACICIHFIHINSQEVKYNLNILKLEVCFPLGNIHFQFLNCLLTEGELGDMTSGRHGIKLWNPAGFHIVAGISSGLS